MTALFVTLLIPVLASGCWGEKELNKIGIVTATGFDLEPDNRIRITALSVQPEGSVTTPVMRPNTWLWNGCWRRCAGCGCQLEENCCKRPDMDP
jgi:hypothetical protein